MIIYLIMSLVIAIIYLKKEIGFENYMSDVAIGDTEFFEKKKGLIDILIYFFPISLIIVYSWAFIVSRINNKKEA